MPRASSSRATAVIARRWSSAGADPPKTQPQTHSVVAQGVDELALVHLRAALDAHLGRPLLQLVLGLVLVARGLPALLGGTAAAGLGVRDARRLLLARSALAQSFVGL